MVTDPSSVPVISWFASDGEKRTASTAVLGVDSSSSVSAELWPKAEGPVAQTNEAKFLPDWKNILNDLNLINNTLIDKLSH